MKTLISARTDYAIVNRSGGTAAVSGGPAPNTFIPSGQGFFVTYANAAPTTGGSAPIFSNTVKFTNAMRVTGNNDQFFKSNTTTKQKSNNSFNRLWVNLTSDNGVFNQILVAYLDGATKAYDGDAYDAPKNLSSGAPAILYSNIENDVKKFAIQGKATSDLNTDEVISPWV